MEENKRVAIGMPNDETVNEELGLIMEEQRQMKKTTHDEEPSKPILSGLWWKQHWPFLKPFVNGGAIGVLAGSWACWIYTKSPMYAFCREQKYHALTKVFPNAIYIHAFTMSQQLALYEGMMVAYAWIYTIDIFLKILIARPFIRFLRKKLIATNEGMQPALYQEVACGLTVGAVGACISFPLYCGHFMKHFDSCKPTEQQSWSVFRRIHACYYDITNKGIRKWYAEDGHLVRFASPLVKRKVWLEMGMLASYSPGLHYLRESCGFSETRAQLGASAISAFFAAACSLPAKHIRRVNQESGYARTSLDCALQILKSRGPLGFFTGFSTCFALVAAPVMTTWFVLERIRKIELSIGL